jgi:hypothetical protein
VKSAFGEVSSQRFIGGVIARSNVFDLDCERSERGKNDVLAVVENRVGFNNLLWAERFFNLAIDVIYSVFHENG